MPEYVKRDIVFTWRDYNRFDLPKDAVITNVIHTGHQVDVYYTSEWDIGYEGKGGFEYFSFEEGKDIEIEINIIQTKRTVVYAKVEKVEGKNLLIVICRWEKKQ